MSDLAPYQRSESDATSETIDGDTSSADVTLGTPEMEERLSDKPEESMDAGKNGVTHGSRDFGGKASVPLRCSNRERKPPNRFGDWTISSDHVSSAC